MNLNIKKVVSIALTAATMASFIAACKTEEPTASYETINTSGLHGSGLIGGWNVPDSYDIDDKLQSVFDAGMSRSDDRNYKAIALLATDVVAGTNYCFLASKRGATSSDTTFALVYINENLNGESWFVKAQPFELDGSWTYPESNKITDEAHYVIMKATVNLMGSNFEPVAYLGKRDTTMSDYAIVCKITPALDNPVSSFQVVYVSEDVSGNPTVYNCQELTIGL